MNRASLVARAVVFVGIVALVTGAVNLVVSGTPDPVAGAIDPSTLAGEGATFFQPVMTKLLQDDATNAGSLNLAYTPLTVDSAISDFVGSGLNQFGADYVVSERPLTSAELSTATADGRQFAYVPFAATPVAIVTTVPTGGFASPTLLTSDFCTHIPLSLTLLGDIFGFDSSNPILSWADPRLECTTAGDQPDAVNVEIWSSLDPAMENEALINLLDSTSASKALFDAGITKAIAGHEAQPTATDAPSENWPITTNAITGGDQQLINKVVPIDPRTNGPNTSAATWTALGATFPVSAVWTGTPLGVPWNLPTAAIQNAQGAYVPPTTASAQAAETDTTLAQTADPTTNNLVTFNASPTDAAAYNNYLMEEEYLVVPTNGLAGNKAFGLAQMIRFLLGTKGQADISSFGAAPANAAMITAGLKVANELDQQAVLAASTSTTTTTAGSTTTTTAAGATTTTAAGSSSTSGTGTGTGSSTGDTSTSGTGSTSGSSPTDSSTGLAFTGAGAVLPLTVVGSAMTVVGTVATRRLRRKRRVTT